MGENMGRKYPDAGRAYIKKPVWTDPDGNAKEVVEAWQATVMAHIDDMTSNYRTNILNFGLYEERFLKKLGAWYKVAAPHLARFGRIWAEKYFAPAPR